MTSITDLSATELLAAYRARKLSPVEATQAVLDHIAAWEPHLNATYTLDPEAALAVARESEARWQRQAPIGALDGVPSMIKENIATRGTPMPLGTGSTLLTPAAQDAPPAARMREAGAVILGKTTMPDYGMLTSGVSSFHGTTRNPWDLATNPGGSSSGAGAGVAAGYGPLHIGTDIGGSVRLPASWCGIFALKPSLGRIPIDPPYAGRCAGPMTRTVADAALMMSVLSQPDWRDAMSLPAQAISWLHLGRDPKDLKIGLWLDGGWGLPVEPEVRAAIEAAAGAFEAAGAHVERLTPFTTREMIQGLDDFWRARCWLDISSLPAERRAKVLPYIVSWAQAADGMNAERLFKGYSAMGAIRDATVRACQPFDYVLAPVAPVPACGAELPGPANDPQRPFEHIAFTVPANMSEQPAASVNCGYTTSGLPIGLQIIGRRHDDLGVLQLAHAWETMRPAQRPWPALPTG